MKKGIFFFLLLGTVVMIIVMGKTGNPLKTVETPYGILNLEFAYTPDKASTVISAWTKSETQTIDIIAAAKNNTWWDFVFIFFYASFLFLSCKLIAESSPQSSLLYRAGRLFARLILVVVVLDVLENIGMFQLLNRQITLLITYFTSGCSLIKWLLVIAVILFVIIGGGYTLITSNRRKSVVI